MSKLKLEAQELLRYPTGDRDERILQGLIEFGTLNSLVKNSDFKKRTVQRRLAAMRKSATRLGYNYLEPARSPVLTHPLSGRSDFVKHDPPLADGTTHTWYKQKAEDVITAEIVKAMVEGIQVTPVKARKPKKGTSGEVLPILTIADAHLGMLTARGESGIEWGLDLGLQLNRDAIDYLVEAMPEVEKAVFVNLGDFTHADGLRAETPRSKNMLDVSHRFIDVSRAAGELLRYAIDRLMEKANEVQVFNIRGNHDDITAWHLNEKLMALYVNEPRVLLDHNDAYTQALQWEENLICMTHGEAVKYQTFYNTITTEFDKQFGDCKYCYALQGHTHHPVSDNIGKVFFETHSTLAVKDAYHVLKQYQSLRRMNLVMLDAKGGEHSRVIYNPRF